MVVINDPTDVSAKENLHDTMMNRALNLSRGHVYRHKISLADFRQFLMIASQIEVELSDDASKLLQSFYVASRKVRVSIAHGTDMPIKALRCM